MPSRSPVSCPTATDTIRSARASAGSRCGGHDWANRSRSPRRSSATASRGRPPVAVSSPAGQELPLSGLVAVVTGAAGGFGRATAARLLREGARVALWDIDEDRVVATARELDRDDTAALAVG